MKYLNLKTLIAGGAALLLMSGTVNQVLAAAPAKPVITSANTKSCVVGLACSYQITATNSPTSYGATPIPAGMSLSGSVISGTPTTVATTTVTVSATNAGGTGSLAVAFSVTVSPARVVVAPSGGNYTTITAALAGINPTATNPCVIEVWPGVYTEPGTVVLKSYVHIKGSGRDVTTVNTSAGNATVISGNSLTNVTVSGLTITGGWYGIYFRDVVVGTISENLVSNNTYGMMLSNSVFPFLPNTIFVTENKVSGNSVEGIYVVNASVLVTNNFVSGNSYNAAGNAAIDATQSDSSTISGNVITDNHGYGIIVGAVSATTISNNIITSNGSGGLYYYFTSSGGSATNNKIVNNGGPISDVVVGIEVAGSPALSPNISLNIFDDISGTRGVGSYNVNSNGDPILVP